GCHICAQLGDDTKRLHCSLSVNVNRIVLLSHHLHCHDVGSPKRESRIESQSFPRSLFGFVQIASDHRVVAEVDVDHRGAGIELGGTTHFGQCVHRSSHDVENVCIPPMSCRVG